MVERECPFTPKARGDWMKRKRVCVRDECGIGPSMPRLPISR